MRCCRKCERLLADDRFYASSPRLCKDCCNARTQASRRADPETARRYGREAYRQLRAERIAGLPRTCAKCGDAMAPELQANAKYCSRQCLWGAAEDRRKAALAVARAGRLCERCGNEIPVAKSLQAKTCSKRCRDALNERALMHRRCRALSNYAVKVGRLVRQPCEVCGSADVVEMHHVDYFEPLNVRWLCFLHHRTVMHGQRVREESR